MTYFAVNWLAIIVATVVSWAIGAGWYMALAKQWMAAIGKTRDQIDGKDPTPYIWSVVVQLVMAYFLALLIPVIYGQTDAGSGLLTGLHMWIGFVITSMILNHRYQDKSWSLTLIDGGYLLAVLLVQGLVIGLFGNPMPEVAPPA